MVMGNVSGRRDEAEASRIKNEDDDDDEEEEAEEEGEEYMEYAHGGGAQLGGYHQVHAGGRYPESMVQSPPHSSRAYHSPFIFAPQIPMVPLQRPGEAIRNQAVEYEDIPSGNGIATMITWNYGGNQVAIEGSWDNWKTREFLQKTGKEFTIVKMLPAGLYHYRFVADGHYRYDPDSPHERDDRGNVFNVLDLQDQAPEIMDNIGMTDDPASSPVSTYTSTPFSLEDFNEKLPDLPPLLQKTPLHQPSSSLEGKETLEKPSPAILNHLYIQKRQTDQSMVALSSTHRFRRKYVTTILYKSLKNPKK